MVDPQSLDLAIRVGVYDLGVFARLSREGTVMSLECGFSHTVTPLNRMVEKCLGPLMGDCGRVEE